MIVAESWIRCGLRAFLGLAIGLLGVTRAGAASTDSPEAQSIQHFEAKVRPVLVASCVRCHGPEKQRGGLRVDTREALLRGGESGPALVPGQAEESLLYQKLVDGEMPPRTEPRLDAAQVADIRQWIRAGAPVTALKAEIGRANAEDWWAFRRPDRGRAVAALPPSLKERLGVETRWKLAGGGFEVVDEHRSGSSRIHPIDAFVGDELAKQGLESAPRADRRTLVRRAYFDLLGLPPTPEQVEAFVNDPAPRAWERLLASLLASPHYGERWGRHWLDVARYADSGGYETDMYYRLAWRYRDYVVRSFNEDKPYSRFVQEQIAGDELWPDDLELHGTYALAESKRRALEAHVGTGFYALGPQIHESSMDARKADQERLTDWVDATGSAFLGITLGCARCHDHKFDPFTQQDYYGLQAIFARSREGERAIINGMEHADFKQHYPRILAVAAARDAYRRHEQALAGRPPSPAEAAQRDELLRAIGRAVLEVPERATSTPNTPFDGLLELPRVAVLEHERPELVKPVHLLARGDLKTPRQVVKPALPAVLAASMQVPPAVSDGLTSRKDLALWLTRPDHPLTARVIVNRIWQWHFGRGFVATASDFGRMGQPPTHPALLDWLACEFVDRGWSVKALHFLIMTSDAYCRASDFAPPQNQARDPQNLRLWRFNRLRLEGEGVWDAIHAVAGTLNLDQGGPPVAPPLTGEELSSLRDRHRWIVSPDPRQHTRRGLYVVSYRNFRFPLFEVFDAPNSAVSVPGRDDSTVAPQALWLLNNPTVWRQAQHLAARVVRQGGPKTDSRIATLWRLALGRAPRPAEIEEAEALLRCLAETPAERAADLPPELSSLPPAESRALVLLCLGIFNHNEFLYID